MSNSPKKSIDGNDGNLDEQQLSNIDLIYGYTEAVLKSKIDNIKNLDARLATFLGFAGGLLKLYIDIPIRSMQLQRVIYYTLQVLKVSGGITAVAAIILIATVLTSRFTADVTSPTALTRDGWYWARDEDAKKVIVKQWLKAIDSVDSLARRKGKFLNAAIRLIALGGILYGISFILITIFNT